MEKIVAERMLEQVARNLTAIERISRILAGLVEVKDRRLYSPMLKELLNSNYDLQHEIGKIHPELDTMYLGLQNFALLRKKYEDPEHPISMPTQNDIDRANESWSKIESILKK